MVALDSGSTYMSVPKYAAAIIKEHEFPLEGQSLPCGAERLGNITLVISGIHFNLTPDDWQYRQSDKKKCTSSIMTLEVGYEMFMVGDRFMRRYYTVFDRDHDKVGLAESINIKK